MARDFAPPGAGRGLVDALELGRAPAVQQPMARLSEVAAGAAGALAIGGASARGFDGESSLIGERGWLWR